MSASTTALRRPGLIALASVLLASVVSVPALGQEVEGARVVRVDDRQVTVSVPQPERDRLRSPSSLTAYLEVEGRQIPAEVTPPRTDARRQVSVLVLDASGSMSGEPMRQAREAASTYLESLPADVEVGLVTFADAPRVEARIGSSDARLREALDRVAPQGDTSLYDGVRAGVELVPSGAEARLLVLTDGEDTSSSATLDEAVEATQDAQVATDVVLLGPDAGRRAMAQRLAASGRVTSATDADSLTRSFVDAAKALGPRYTVVARIPEAIDAAGRQARVIVDSEGSQVSATVVLPEVSSLSRMSSEASIGGPSEGAALPTDDEGDVVTSAVEVASASGWMAAIAAIAVMALVLALAWSGWELRAESRRRRRMGQVLAYGTGGRDHGGASMSQGPVMSRVTQIEDRLLASALGRGLRTRLEAAELPLSPLAWLALLVAGAALVTAAIGALLDVPWIALVLGLTLVPLAFVGALRWRVGRRQREFSDELPEFLLLLSSALRAGLSFIQALASAAEQQRGQVGRQIRRALAEAQLSGSLDEALMSCAHRMGSEDLRWAVTALSVQREVGGNLSVILDNTAATIKARQALGREVRALSAEGRLSAYVLIALPVGVFGFLVLFRREYISQLWSHPLGITMLIALVLLMTVGWVWMRAVVRIRV